MPPEIASITDSRKGTEFEKEASLRCFYETAGIVKVFVFAFVFSLLAFLLLLLSFVRVWKIHLGLLYALV